MTIIRPKLGKTKQKLSSRAGLILPLEVMRRIQLPELADQVFPTPGSNRGYKPSVYLQSFVTMLNEGGRCLDDIRHLRAEKKLLALLGMDKIPSADALGDWLRRMGQGPGLKALTQVNQKVLSTTLKERKKVVLDIDATAILCSKKSADWTYLKAKGYMPMVGTICDTGQVVSTDFRRGNTPPAKSNLEFIQQCVQSLPEGVQLSKLRIDAAGYQRRIIEYCQQHQIGFAIRAKMCSDIKELIDSRQEQDWQPLRLRSGNKSSKEQVYLGVHIMNDMTEAFSLVIQRQLKAPVKTKSEAAAAQSQMELGNLVCSSGERAESREYVYRAIATNRSDLDASGIVHWYNKRGDHSENRIKELKIDFAGQNMPCSDFEANAMYFALCALAMNVYVLLRYLLPVKYMAARVSTVRLRLYDLAAKIVRHARQLTIKLQEEHYVRLQQALDCVRQGLPLPHN